MSTAPTGAGQAMANETNQDARTWAMLCHLSMLSGLVTGFGFWLGPIIVWLIKKNDHSFVDEHGKEAVNFMITVTLAGFVCGILVFVLIGVFLLMALGVISVVMPIIAGLKANNGEHYQYPAILRLIK